MWKLTTSAISGTIGGHNDTFIKLDLTTEQNTQVTTPGMSGVSTDNQDVENQMYGIKAYLNGGDHKVKWFKKKRASVPLAIGTAVLNCTDALTIAARQARQWWSIQSVECPGELGKPCAS